MDPFWAGIVISCVLLVLLIGGVPVGFSLGLSGVFGFVLLRGWYLSFEFLALLPHSLVGSWVYVILPLFILMGHFAFGSGLTDKAYNLAQKWLGNFPGGLIIATIFACAIFSAASGSSLASAAVFTKVALPELKRRNYDTKLALGAIASAAVLDVMIPPSGIMVLYSILTGVSLGKIMIAGFVPGFISAILFIAMIVGLVWIKPQLAPKISERITWKERIVSLKDAIEVVLLIGVVMGGIYFGLVTATEAAALGAALALVLLLIHRGKGAIGHIMSALQDAASTTAFVFIIVMGAGLFTTFMMQTGMPQSLAAFMVNLGWSKLQLTIILLAPYFILGMFLDPASMLFLTLPFCWPIVQAAGIEPIWFGILVVKLVEISMITPPVGMTVYVVHGLVPEVSVGDIFKGTLPFLIMEIVSLFLLLLFPSLSLFLVEMMHY